MADLEALVRPFQAPAPTATRRIVSVRTKVPTETAGVAWGAAGALPTAVEVPPGADPFLFNFNVKKWNQETSRETETVRVENPSDPSQYVMVERIKKITFKEKDPETVATYPKASSATVTQVTTPPPGMVAAPAQVSTDGTGPTPDSWVTIDEREYELNWPEGEGEDL